MTNLINLKSKSQYAKDIDKRFQPSACGPVTAYLLLDYHFPNRWTEVNELYRRLGGTKIGLFTWRFIRNTQKLLGPNWAVSKCSINDVKKQLDAGRPVAAKFDKWFTFNWRGRYSFDYHWVPVIGYDMNEDQLMLIIHDNGGRNRPSKIQSIPYYPNKKILTFVKMEPKTISHT